MITIARLLADEAPSQIFDKSLGWGARTSAYKSEIDTSIAAGRTPVLIELEDDLGLDMDKVLIVDHHGDAPGMDRSSSLRQVFELLRLPEIRWSRHYELVEANDRGYIPALISSGAVPTEIRTIRTEDRAAQGITPDQESAAVEALKRLEYLTDGNLIVANLPHARTAALVDRLQPESGGPGAVNLLIRSPEEINIFRPGIFDRNAQGYIPEWLEWRSPAALWLLGSPQPSAGSG